MSEVQGEMEGELLKLGGSIRGSRREQVTGPLLSSPLQDLLSLDPTAMFPSSRQQYTIRKSGCWRSCLSLMGTGGTGMRI